MIYSNITAYHLRGRLFFAIFAQKQTKNMAKNDTEKYINEIVDMIKSNPIFTFTDIFVYYKAISRATAYNLGLDKIDTIKEAIYANKRKGVTSLLAKWLKSENPTLEIAAMRMLCDPDEHRKLNQNYTDHTTDGQKINDTTHVVEFVNKRKNEV